MDVNVAESIKVICRICKWVGVCEILGKEGRESGF